MLKKCHLFDLLYIHKLTKKSYVEQKQIGHLYLNARSIIFLIPNQSSILLTILVNQVSSWTIAALSEVSFLFN